MNRADLRTAILARSDYTDSNFVSATVLNVWVDQAMRELYDLVVLAHPDTYSDYRDVVIPSTGLVALDATCYKVRAVDLDPASPNPTPLRRFNFAERNRVRGLAYHDLGNSVKFMPTQLASGKSVRIWFVPKLVVLADDSTSLDSTMEAYAEYVIAECAAKVLEKAEDFEVADRIRMRKNDLENKLRAMIPRDVGEPEQVADVTSSDCIPRWWLP